MKKVLVILLSAVLFATFASAELLVTANPLGQGKWGVLGSYLTDSNVGSFVSTLNATGLGGYVGYGLTDKLDLLVSLGQGTIGGLPAGVTMSQISYGANLKYTLMTEGKDLPVSVAIGAGYKAMTTTSAGFPGSGTTNGNQIVVAAGVSKVIVPFVPYGGLTYRKTTSGGADFSTQLDLTVGTAIAWSQQGAVFLEYSSQAVTPTAGGNYTNGEFALGVGYSI